MRVNPLKSPKLEALWQTTARLKPLLYDRIENLKLGEKLNLGFGTLVVLTFLVVGRTYLSSVQATSNISRTQDVRMPSALASAEAQTNLLKMLSDLRAYLATGESKFRSRYQETRQAFETDLTSLNEILNSQGMGNHQRRLQKLKQIYQQWSELPDQLFDLRDDAIDNQPALRILEQDGELLIANISTATQQMLQQQEEQLTSASAAILYKDMVEFHHSFALLVSALRTYIAVREPAFRFEYGANLKTNQAAWERLNRQKHLLTPSQRTAFEKISTQRRSLLKLPQSMFEVVESERYREDLYLFRSQAEPLASEMLTILDSIVTDQQKALTQELQAGNTSLTAAQWQNFLTGLVAVGLSIGMTVFVRRQIARPVQRLTEATSRITAGDFEVLAPVDSKDEIGTLAVTFNRMTHSLKESREKLEHYSRNLEDEVVARTQELQEKNQQLEQAFDELKHAQAQLVQTEKMSSLGQLVAGIAHEINNPVNFIHGNVNYTANYAQDLLELVNLYQRQYPEASPEIQDKIAEIDLPFLMSDFKSVVTSMKVGTERIREIVKSLRTFSRLDEAEVKNVDLHEGLDSTLMILQSRLKADSDRPAIDIIKHYGEIPKIECYAGQLNQVFMNILSNAIDALEDAIGKGHFASYHEQTSELERTSESSQPCICIRTGVMEGDRILIQIIDNGLGMTEEVQQRLFDPFFTTKAVGKGTGLGMSISHQIITEKHGGSLSCRSTPGAGAEFRIEIPIHSPSICVVSS